MSRGTWEIVKQSKRFYVMTYRKTGTALLFSAALNVLLGAGIYYTYFHQPERDFYATNGITPPVELTPLDEPNYTSDALLASDPVNDTNDAKVIPQ
ncbi:type IVB secretion system protein IcmM/DotJ [Legionella impletisoli]|uniref:Phosphoesterase n=1 Tax=Legionella impletisoli TaxID=343510 RepID=A0A917JW60_9GAMM|nr:type IVB secretion system protein IcmM/DotJ [Legionella impletisoli]GGI89926.1 phosphoesterase [Legionella impletisoli]